MLVTLLRDTTHAVCSDIWRNKRVVEVCGIAMDKRDN